MADVKKGDRVIVTQGAFKGEKGVVVTSPFFGGIKVALKKNGERIDTHTAHVMKDGNTGWW